MHTVAMSSHIHVLVFNKDYKDKEPFMSANLPLINNLMAIHKPAGG